MRRSKIVDPAGLIGLAFAFVLMTAMPAAGQIFGLGRADGWASDWPNGFGRRRAKPLPSRASRSASAGSRSKCRRTVAARSWKNRR